MLRNDPYLSEEFDYDAIIELALSARGEDEYGYRSEFVQLVRAAETAAAFAVLQQHCGTMRTAMIANGLME